MVSWRVTFTDAFSDSQVIRHGHVADLPFDEVLQYVCMTRKWFKVLRWPERRLIERGTYRWPRTWILTGQKGSGQRPVGFKLLLRIVHHGSQTEDQWETRSVCDPRCTTVGALGQATYTLAIQLEGRQDFGLRGAWEIPVSSQSQPSFLLDRMVTFTVRTIPGVLSIWRSSLPRCEHAVARGCHK